MMSEDSVQKDKDIRPRNRASLNLMPEKEKTDIIIRLINLISSKNLPWLK